MKRKKRGSLFGGLLVFILLVLVACTVAVNLIFNNDRVPRVAGYYLYMQESDDMTPAIPEKSLVAAEAAVISELHEGNKVLCYLSDGTLALRNIYKIEETDSGTVNYYPGTVKEQGTDSAIPRTNIFAVCVWASPELYWYVSFATSVNGLMAFLVAPCVLLIIMLLIHIARNGGEDMEDEEFPLEEEPEEIQPKKKKKAISENPLYAPESSSGTETPEEKKSSVSENFSPKPVSENPPYQNAVQEQEKTTKFRRQELEEEALRALEAPYPKRRQSGASGTQVYSAEEIREQARLQAQQKNTAAVPSAPPPPAPAVHTAQFTAPMPAVQNEPAVPAEPAPQAAPVQEVPAPAPAPVAEPPKASPKPTYSSPNIDDILQSSKKKNSEISSTDSIDDLIRLLEKEKSKL